MAEITPRPAATVTLVREAPGGFEVLMMQRNHQSVFMPGMHVFPGGAVDKSDFAGDYETLSAGMDDSTASRILGLARGGLAYWIAAIRESFEEAGILFACDENGAIVTLDESERAARFHDYRRRVEHGEHPFSTMLKDEGLRLPLEQMVYFSHWITPVGAPRRYDTRFFVAVAPESQAPLHDNRETISHVWIKPSAALDGNRKGTFQMRTPTVHTLGMFAQHDSIGSLLKAMAQRGSIPVMEPRIAKDGRRLLPGESGYEEAGTTEGRGNW